MKLEQSVKKESVCLSLDLAPLEIPMSESNPTTEILRIRLFPCEKTTALRDKWLAMEAVCEHTFFTSWDWISCWMDTVGSEILQCEAWMGENLVGLGLFVEKRERGFGIVSFRRLFLHQTGDRYRDRMCIEWNDLLIWPGLEQRVRRQVVAELTRGPKGADEVVFGFTPEGHNAGMVDPGFVPRIGYPHPSPFVDLVRVRAEGGFDNTLSHKTRSNVRKSMRLAEAIGPIELQSAASPEEGLSFFREAGPLHIERFKDRADGRHSGYLNPNFVAFHERLIPVAFQQGNLDFVKVTAGGVLLAYMYFFVYRKVVLFYQSAINYSGFGKGQPGLIANYLCIRKFSDQGMDKYDFLAGDSLYKRVLATDTVTMRFFNYRKRSLKMEAAERYLSWKHRTAAE
jgi:CelD/BcsL family acetyltransferase involved in cellulose biosynthesis